MKPHMRNTMAKKSSKEVTPAKVSKKKTSSKVAKKATKKAIKKPVETQTEAPVVTVSQEAVVLLGYFWVNTGTVSVGDPSYLSGRENPFKSWGAFCDKMFGKSSLVVAEEEGAGTQVTFKIPSQEERSYPVYGAYNEDGVLVSATISFE